MSEVSQNWCEDCKHCNGYLYCVHPEGFLFGADPQEVFHVKRKGSTRDSQLACKVARAYHAKSNLIDPVPCCPKYEVK